MPGDGSRGRDRAADDGRGQQLRRRHFRSDSQRDLPRFHSSFTPRAPVRRHRKGTAHRHTKVTAHTHTRVTAYTYT